MTAIRYGCADDLETVAAIQEASAGAAGWKVGDYLEQDFLVAIAGNRVVGFLVSAPWRKTNGKILNLAVGPDFRRKGVARALFEIAMQNFSGDVFLEVRESNRSAHRIL